MKDHNPARPGSRAGGITSTFLAAGALHSHSTSISSFADLSASSTNIYSSHARRVRSVRKLRQLLGPDEDVGSTERMETSINKELPLPPPPLPSPLITIPSDNALTMQPPTPLSDINSEDEEGERALSLVYARRVKLEKLKRRFGEDVPKELIFFDQPGPLSPTLNHKGRSMSSPNAMTFSESDEISRGHTKNASFSTTNPANVPALALKRSKATNMLRLWKSKSRSEDSKLPELDIVEENFDDVLQTDTEKGVGSVNAEAETPYPVQLTSLEGSDWCKFSKANNEKGLEVDFPSDDAFMNPQSDITVSSSGVQVMRSSSTLVIDRTSEDDERNHFSTLVESARKSMFFSAKESAEDNEYSYDTFSRDQTVEISSSTISPRRRVPRKARSAVALASDIRIQATTLNADASSSSLPPRSVTRTQSWEASTPSTSSTPSPILHSSYHSKNASWNDDSLVLAEDGQTGRFTNRALKPKGPRPSLRSRPRTADGAIRSPKTQTTEFRHSDEAIEHWRQLEQQQKVNLTEAKSSKSTQLTRNSLPPPPLPTKSPKYPKFNVPPEETSAPEPSLPASQKIVSSKPMATVIYFYHRGVVRLVVEDGARGPKTMQTVYMRDVLNYLREMRCDQ